MVLENVEEVGMGNSLLSEALLSLDEINSSKCIPIGDGKVKCLICDRELKRDSWKRHISSVHSNNRPYSCNMCNTTFKVSKNIPLWPPKGDPEIRFISPTGVLFMFFSLPTTCTNINDLNMVRNILLQEKGESMIANQNWMLRTLI